MRSISSITINCLAFLLGLCFFFGITPVFAADNELNLCMVSTQTKWLNPLQAEEREFQSLTALIYEGL
ncbi:MAG: hypothetical protein IJ968_10145, partial [Clostridia bacterium]|nr:hypothetical protein [Clostridia bacterium]